MKVVNNPAILAAIQKANENKYQVSEVIPGQKYQPKISAGNHIAVVTNALYEQNQPSRYGLNHRVKVFFDVYVANSDEAVELISSYWQSASETSLYHQHLSALLGRNACLGFVLNEFIGTVCQIEVVHNETDKGIYANIQTIDVIDTTNLDNQIVF